jgi:hypothetical protein
MYMNSNPTPYDDVNAALRYFLKNTQAILGQHFRGMYLLGSLALGDFASNRSDVDFVIVTDEDASDEQLIALQTLHADFNASDSPWAKEIEADSSALGAGSRGQTLGRTHRTRPGLEQRPFMGRRQPGNTRKRCERDAGID